MKTEKDKMLAGELYDPRDPQLSRERHRCRVLCRRFNETTEDEGLLRMDLLSELFGADTGVMIEPPFHCDYGFNIELGKNVFFNFNCVVLDVMKVKIGSNVLIGPAVQIYTATHPLDSAERRALLEYAKPIGIGDDVWIGGGAIICAGVSIGERTVIGAGSVVVKDLPADVIAAGNPARIVRTLR